MCELTQLSDAACLYQVNRQHVYIFTTRYAIVQSTVLRSHVVCLSVCLSVCLFVCEVGGS